MADDFTTQDTLWLIQELTEDSTAEEQAAYIESLELFILKCREKANQADATEMYADAVYDTAIEQLTALKPDSEILKTTWSADADIPLDNELDSQLIKNPMMSIQTIKSLDTKEFLAFAARVLEEYNSTKNVEMHASMKLNGHGIRIVYKDGKFVKAHTRGRSSNGRDITRQVAMLVPANIPALVGKGIVEMRGEVVLPLANMAKARTYRPDIKSPFSGVSAMLRDSASEEETKLLKFIAYACYADFALPRKLGDIYKLLSSYGFEVPMFATFAYAGQDMTAVANFIIQKFEQAESNYGIYTDGVVLSVNDLDTLDKLGWAGTSKQGNVALKVGFWAQNLYAGEVEEILWKEGRSKKTPVAHIKPVVCANGATVTNVPLYAPIYILNLEAYPGNIIHFRYGGEAGVVPCYSDGRLVTE